MWIQGKVSHLNIGIENKMYKETSIYCAMFVIVYE